ncbi:MAG: diacylglycerol kinase family lipid kinase [Flavobacteriaceae bacterium]|nr:diacylglycerol kinase family lipid kinase [Flavobacteriaceae bacterium]
MDIKWFVIVNPVAGNGETAQKWHEIEEELKQQKFDYKVAFSEYKSHESVLVQSALEEGYTHIICVGGDGTLHNVVNGLMNSPKSVQQVKLGIIPLGTGNDWIKTYNIEKDYKLAIQILKNNNAVFQDIGFLKLDNSKQHVYFNNLAGIGFDGYVVHKVHHYKKMGVLAYLVGALVSIAGYKRAHLKIEMNGSTMHLKSLLFLMGLCEYCGGGMKLTKKVDPSDGLFDITSVEKITFLQLVTNLTGLFNGNITQKKFVKNFKTDALKVTLLKGDKAYIQADGELIGIGGFELKMHAKALQFIVPKPKS